MKVLIHYEDNLTTELHKTLKITLPKSWKTGPTSKLLGQFVETYNGNETLGASNPLDVASLHLSIRRSDDRSGKSQLVNLASDEVVLDVIPDRADVYVMHGPSKTLAEIKQEITTEAERKKAEQNNTVACTHFGCKIRFPPGGPYPECVYHSKPPVFHETAKFWSCCPQKKAYDWDDFQKIPGCQKGRCTDVKNEDGQKQFLGGTDLREAAGEAVKLKSIDDYNRAQAAGGAEAAPVLDRLQKVLMEMGIENELYTQVVDCIRNSLQSSTKDEAELLEAVKADLGDKLKSALKSIAAEQLRIK